MFIRDDGEGTQTPAQTSGQDHTLKGMGLLGLGGLVFIHTVGK